VQVAQDKRAQSWESRPWFDRPPWRGGVHWRFPLRRRSHEPSAPVCYAFRVLLERYVYPALKEPLLEAYEMAFEAAYIVLHPFVRVPDELSWERTRQYPSDADVFAHGSKCKWAEAARGAEIRNCASMSQALLTAIGSIDEFLRDPSASAALQKYLQAAPIWMPTEGRFEPLLQADLLAAFTAAGHTELIHVPEFPEREPIATLQVADVEGSFPERGTLLAPDRSFLFTVDWDSFFTLFYGPRAFVDEVVKSRGLEGFFAEKETEHSWFNWKMGCATCTVSPDGWQAG